MWAHGTAGDQDNPLGTNELTLTEDFIDEGWVVVCSNAAGRAWGKQDSIDDIAAAANYASVAYKCGGDTFLVGQSMGGVPTLVALANDSIPNIRGWAGIAPVCDMNAVFDDGVYTAEIRAAYGFSGVWDDTATAGHDPVNDFVGSDFTGANLRFYASASDTSIVKTENADAMHTLVSGDAADSSVVTVTGTHLSADHYRPANLTPWFSSLL